MISAANGIRSRRQPEPALPVSKAAEVGSLGLLPESGREASPLETEEGVDHLIGWVTPHERRHLFLLVRYVLIVAVSSLVILNARSALSSHQVILIAVALASNAIIGRVGPRQFFQWWVQGPVLIADTVWIALILLSAGFGQQFFLFYFVELFLAAITESLGLLAVGATLIGIISIVMGTEGAMSASTLIRVPFFFATAVFYGYVVDMAKQQRRFSVQRELWAQQLEREVRIRTHEVEQQSAELRRMYDEVREADRLKSDFVANMSHELRTPIHIIIGYTDLALEHPQLPAESEVRTFLRRIAGRTRALHRLVENVLDYANLERGRARFEPRRFPVDVLISDLGTLCTDLPQQPGLVIRLTSAPGVEITTDYDRLQSVLSNLLLNAVKFTPSGEVGLAVSEAGDEIEFSVRDTGIGIPAQEMAHIFEPFRQADGSSTRSFEGVGIGLAVVSRNLKLLRGRVDVESQIGKGSTFRVHVPRHVNGVDGADAAACNGSRAA